MTVPAEADQIDHYIAAERVAVLQRHATDTNHRIGILTIHVKIGIGRRLAMSEENRLE